jgi:hypothetical protein
MKTHTRLSAAVLKLVFLFLTLLALGGCGMILTASAKYKLVRNGPLPDPGIGEDLFIRETAARLGLMALFAEVSYRDDLVSTGRDETACTRQTSADLKYGMPEMQDGSGSWQRWLPGNGIASCINDPNGLFYEIYLYTDRDGLAREAVIAFRGTENRRGQYVADWSSNFAAFLGYEPAQYKLALEKLPAAVTGLRALNPAIDIFAVGHSLGGGLAQQAGYRFSEIREVYTFNTSPVTNWSHMQWRLEVSNHYPVIFRVYHTGEILEKIRFITTSFTSSRYNRYDLGLQLWPKTFFRGHGMMIMACGFADIISREPDDFVAAHYYDRKFATDGVKLGPLCSDFREDDVKARAAAYQ